MKQIIDDKNVFAAQIDIIDFTPDIIGKSTLWIGGDLWGDYDEKNILAQFIRSLWRLTYKYEELFHEELQNLSCLEMFRTINPFYDNPDAFYDLSDEEQNALTQYDRNIFQWGENFDSTTINVVYDQRNLVFLCMNSMEENSGEIQNVIKCYNVPLSVIEDVYKKVSLLIPDKYWYAEINKFK